MITELYIILTALSASLISSGLTYALLRRSAKNKKRSEDDLFDQKIMLLTKEIIILEKKYALQEHQMANLAASIVSFEKILTTLIKVQTGPVGGGFDPGDDTVH